MIRTEDFTENHKAQIRKALDGLMRCGTSHIALRDAMRGAYDKDNGVQWWTVTANMPYTLTDDTGTSTKTKKFTVFLLVFFRISAAMR